MDKTKTVSKKYHDEQMRFYKSQCKKLANDWRESTLERNTYRAIAEGLGRLLWDVITRRAAVKDHAESLTAGTTCGHCRASSLFAALSAATGKRPKDWMHWTTTDYDKEA